MTEQAKARVMSTPHLGFHPLDGAEGGAVADEILKADSRREVTRSKPDDSGLLAAADRDQLEREIAAIESASDALRRGDPELRSWTDLPAPTMHKPRPVWLLIGVLWLSTALVTIGAVFAISALVG
jgi:hypothetical protein